MSTPLPSTDPRPVLTVIAGPAGSGKSSLKADLEQRGEAFDRHIDARTIADAIEDEARVAATRAASVAGELMRRCLALRQDFSVETDLSEDDDLELLRRAKHLGFETHLYFIATADPSINRARLEARAEDSGDAVPTAKIYTSYWRIMQQLSEAAWLVNRTTLFDNSEEEAGYQITAECENGTITLYADPLPDWVNTFFVKPLAGNAESA